MDTSNSAPSRAKKLKKKGRDRISDLPDNVLHHILSFLNMKLVVRTSILSKRWRYVWTSCPILNFKFKLKQSRRVTQQQQAKYFKDFIDRTLLLRDNSNIERFNIFCENNLKIANRLNTWTHVAVKRNVQELLVDVIYVKIFSLPDCLFFCKSLTKLVLKTHNAGGPSWISLPDSMSLPALKTLHLETFLLDDEDSITDLLTSSPVLESLIIMKCAFHRVNLNISSHKLKHLTLVKDKSGGCFVSNYASKDYEVKLNAPNLTSFICKDYMSKFYNIENLFSIVKVDINFDMEVEEVKEARSTYVKLPEGKKQTYATEKKKKKQLYAQQMMKILGVLYNVKDLTLSAWFLEVVSGALDIPDSPAVQFCNLRCLKLRTWRRMDCARIVMYLLELSPNIESLSVEFAKIPLSSPFFEKNPAGKDYWEERLSLNCMLHQLTSVKLQDFSGCYPELKFVEFLLKNAMNLQKLMICFSAANDSKNNGNDTVLKLSKEKREGENSSSGVTGIITTTTTTMDNNRGKDHISKLPDNVLYIILSLLDIKKVVQTSILSSRWRYLWISVPILNIDQKVFQSRNTMTSNSYRRNLSQQKKSYGKFVKFVDMVLQTKTSIQKLVLCYGSDYNSDDLVEKEQLCRWIVDAVRLKVSELDLQIHYYGHRMSRLLALPLCLFTCKTLTSLKLSFSGLKYVLDLSLPDSVCLTSLKTQHLTSLRLIGEESTDSFFSRCPVLETLIIFDCQFKEAYKNNYLPSSIFTCETLVSFALYNFECFFITFNNVPDSVNLPSLKSLVVQGSPLFSGKSDINLFFSSCPALKSLNISFSDLHEQNDVLFRYVLTCKTLVKLCVCYYTRIPDFVDLPCLKTLSLKSLCFSGGGITDKLFLGCPVLETLIIFECVITNSFFFWKKPFNELALKMRRANGSCIRMHSDSMSLPALKTLHLESVLLNDEDSINDLLTRCPVLESLTMMSCEYTRVNLNFSLHKLSQLKLVRNKSVACYVSNYASENYGFKINVPNLTSFICEDYMPNDYIIENLSSIVKVDIKFRARSTYFNLPEGTKRLYARQMMKILGVLCNVKDLALSAWFLEVVSGAPDLPDRPIFQFWNLRCLKLITWRTMNCAHAVMYLLECSPNIETLSVEFAEIPSSCPFSEENHAGKNYWQERLSLNCMLHHLTSVKLQDYTGCYFELKFVEFLLKNAMSLQELKICFDRIWGPRNYVESRVVKLSEEVLSLPRASASVEILIYHSETLQKGRRNLTWKAL